MWQTSSFYKTGERNNHAGLQCQDRVSHYKNENYQAVALADGSGDNDYACMGAQLSSDVLIRLLADNFEELYNMEEAKVQFNVITNVKTSLYNLCEQLDVRLEQLQSTLLGVVVDTGTNRFMAIHLGDGFINIFKHGELHTLSFPENGVNKSYTRLTSNNNAVKGIRVYRGALKDIQGFLLVSDGWGKDTPFEYVEELEDGKVLLNIASSKYEDDVSYIAMVQK